MYLEFKAIGLFSIFLILSCINGITTEKIDTINFVVIHDEDDIGISNLIDFGIKHYKDKYNLGEIYRLPIPLSNATTSTLIKSFEKLLTKETRRPNFALDFTRNWFSGALAQTLLQSYKFPTVSTNVQQKLAISRKYFHETMTKYFIRIYSPETIMSDVALRIITNKSMESFVQHGKYSFVTRIQTKPGTKRLTQPQHNKFHIQMNASIKDVLSRNNYEPRAIFIIGSSHEARETLDSLSKFRRPNGSPFNIWYSWFYIATHVNDKFEPPDHVNRIISLEPEIKESTGLTKAIEDFGTSNLTDLFYLEIFRSVVQTYANMKKNGDWEDWVINGTDYELDLSKNLKKIFENENNNNIFGKFKEVANNTFQSNITFNLRLHAKPDLNVSIGEIVGNISIIKNYTLWNNFYDWKFIKVGIVNDPPFVIANETCLAAVRNTLSRNICYKGFILDLMHIMNKIIIKTSFVISMDKPYGKLVNSQDWSCTMLAFQNQTIDMALGAFAVTPEKAKVVDFSEPFFFDTRNNQSYAFAFQKGKFLMLQYHVSLIISRMKEKGKMEMFRKKWFEDYKCNNCTLSNEH